MVNGPFSTVYHDVVFRGVTLLLVIADVSKQPVERP